MDADFDFLISKFHFLICDFSVSVFHDFRNVSRPQSRRPWSLIVSARQLFGFQVSRRRFQTLALAADL